MISEDVHPHHSMVEVWVGALHDLIVLMLFVVECIETLEDEVKESPKVLW